MSAKVEKTTSEQMERFYELHKKGVVNRANFQKYLENPDSFFGDGFVVTVNYMYAVADMIVAGKYDWVDPGILLEHIAVQRFDEEELRLELVHLNEFVSSSVASSRLNERGYRPATTYELLAFGPKFPREQLKYRILAIGSYWQGRDGRGYVAYLCHSGSERYLKLRWFGDLWDKDFRFLAVRK